MKYIETDRAPAALGHYSQAVAHDGLIYVSGQLPLNPDDLDAPLGDVTSQTLQTIRNLEAILIAAGSDLSKVLKTTIYITDIAIWPEVNAAYAQAFGEHQPARAAVPIVDLPKNSQIEIDAIAAL